MRILSVLLLLTLTAGCNDEVTGNDAPENAIVLGTADNQFTPTTARIRQNGTVTWQFLVEHTVIFETQAGSPDHIQDAVANTTRSRTFSVPGTFRYICDDQAHPPMAGFVNVEAE